MSASTQVLLSVRNVTKRFGPHFALQDVSLDVEQGEFIVLLGPSGCGKTTLLRAIAGFVAPDGGSIHIEGADVTRLPPYRRPINTVFQNYALFPHLNTAENVAYGPRRQGASKTDAALRAEAALALVGHAGLSTRYPAQLSGGQQQRVALARAIVNRPKLLLLDEPLSALDLKLRKRMQIELKHLQTQLGISFLFVTHDQEEAMAMADRIIVMNAGGIEQVGTGQTIYRTPATRFVAEFIGDANLIPCIEDGAGGWRTQIGAAAIGQAIPGKPPIAVLRPEDLFLIERETAEYATAPGIIEDVIRLGGHTDIHVRAGEHRVTSRCLGAAPGHWRIGLPVVLGFLPQHLHVIPG